MSPERLPNLKKNWVTINHTNDLQYTLIGKSALKNKSESCDAIKLKEPLTPYQDY